MPAAALRLRERSIALILLALAVEPFASVAGWLPPQETNAAPPVVMTAEEDHRRMMDLLHITTLRPGTNGNNPQAPNAANYDESKANPYPHLPDPLVLNNGRRERAFAPDMDF